MRIPSFVSPLIVRFAFTAITLGSVRADTFWDEDLAFQPGFEDFRANTADVKPIALPGGDVLVSTSYAFIDGQRVAGLTRIAADGTVDASFQPDLPEDAFVAGVYEDGRLLVGIPQQFPEPGHLYRLSSDGSLDQDFPGVDVLGSTSFAARVRSDGRIWLYGSFETVAGAPHHGLVLLKSDGTLDPSFTPTFDAPAVNDVWEQADGKILAVGSFTTMGGATPWIVRFDVNGMLDQTFSADPDNAFNQSVTVLENGKILVTAAPADIARLNTDGSRDATYAPTLDAPVSIGHPLANGRVYFVRREDSDVALRRLNADGTVDGSFRFATPSGDFHVEADVPATWDETAFYIGRPLTLERSEAREALSQLDSNGALVADFAPRFSVDAATLTLVGRDSEGRYLMTGSFDHVNGAPANGGVPSAVRLNSDGTVDETLSIPDGVVPIAVESDGHFVARGSFGGSSGVARFAPDGTQVAVFPVSVTSSVSVTPDAEGRLYVAGDNGTAITRYLANGTLDASFAGDVGKLPNELLPTAEGKLYVITGRETVISTIEVTRLQANGEVDSSFAKITLPFATAATEFVALPDGGLLMVQLSSLQSHTDYLHFVRYDANGQIVMTFDGAADSLVLAGVMLDSLLATGDGELRLHSVTLSGNELMPAWTDVRSDGEVSFVTSRAFDLAGPMVRYLRTAVTSPSVEMAPVIGRAPTGLTVEQDSSAVLSVQPLGLWPFSFQWNKDGEPIDGATQGTLSFFPASPADSGSYTVTITNSAGSVTSMPVTLTVNPVEPAAPQIASTPNGSVKAAGGSATLIASASGHPLPVLQWLKNGIEITDATNTNLFLSNLQAGDTGLYALRATNDSGSVTSLPGVVGITTTEPVLGDGSIVANDVVHPNGKVYDQVLMTGAATAITAGPGKVTRTSFIDLNDNIVQVEFSGAGTLSLVLDDPQGPAEPANYNQNVEYMKGHVGIVIAGADQTTNVSVFAVGRATAFDPTHAYDILLPPSETNVPANNGSPLFVGHENTDYNGTAQIAFIAIAGQTDFGGVRTANVHYYARKGVTGLYAPRTSFFGPVYIGEITAFDDATPVIILGNAPTDARITGGNLAQDNDKPVEVDGLTELKFTAGSDAEGRALPAQNNQAVLERNGEDVTSQIVLNPTP